MKELTITDKKLTAYNVSFLEARQLVMYGITTWTQSVTQSNLLFILVTVEVGEQVHLHGRHICDTQTMAIWE